MNKRIFTAFAMIIILIITVCGVTFAESITIIEKTPVIKMFSITGKPRLDDKEILFNNVMDFYNEKWRDDAYADFALAFSADIESSNSLWNFDMMNETVHDVCYVGMADFDTAGMNDLIIAFCNKRGKFAIALYDYTDHVLGYIDNERFTEEEVIAIMEKVCFTYRPVPRKVLKNEAKLMREAIEIAQE